MSDIVLDHQQQLLYYHLIDYSKIVLIIEKALELSCCKSESVVRLQLISAFEAIQSNCISACNWYGASVDDAHVIRGFMLQLSSSQLSELGFAVFQDVMKLANPLLVLLRGDSQLPEETLQKRIINEMLSDVLTRVKQTLPERHKRP